MASYNSEDLSIWLPFDLVEQILWRLPVKSLLRFRTVCKSWNSTISDPKFPTNHLLCSKKNLTHHRILLSLRDTPPESESESLRAYPLYEERRSCIFNGHPKGSPLSYPRSNPDSDFIIGSCDGILCFAAAAVTVAGGEDRPFLVWNPSIRKFKELERLTTKHPHKNPVPIYGFGYDHSCDDYKVVAGFCYRLHGGVFKCQINVNDLRTNVWRRRKKTQSFPGVPKQNDEIGRFVSGTVNWLVKSASSFVIVSFDLKKECCQEISQPDYGVDSSVFDNHPDMFCLKLEVLRDCLSIIARVRDNQDNEDYEFFWVMKEYGNKESWTKLFKIRHLPLNIEPSWYGSFARIVCILKDSRGNDVLFLRWGSTLAVQSSTLSVYYCKHGGNHGCMFESFKPFNFPGFYVESLISPCI